MPTKRQVLLLLSAISVILTLSVSLHQVANNPEGRYLNDGISLQGRVYYEFKDGRVWMVILQGQSISGSELSRYEIATYTDASGKWTMSSKGSEPKVVEVGLLSIRILDHSGKVEMELPRMVLIFGRLIKVYTP